MQSCLLVVFDQLRCADMIPEGKSDLSSASVAMDESNNQAFDQQDNDNSGKKHRITKQLSRDVLFTAETKFTIDV